MKKIKLLAVGLLLALGVNAQTPDYIGSKQDFKDGGISSAVRGSLIGVIDDKLYVSSARSNGIGAVTEKRFEVYDVKTLKEVKRKVIADSKKDKMIDESVYDIVGNNIIAFSYVQPAKGDKTSDFAYYMMKYDATTLEQSGDKVDLFNLKREKAKVFNFSTLETSNKSPDNKYLAFAVTNLNTGDLKVALVDEKGGLLWTAEDKITMPADYTVNSLQVVLNNKAEVVVKMNIQNWDKGVFSSLHSFDAKGAKIASAKFEVKPQIIQNAKIAVTNKGGFVIGGISTKEYQSEDYAYTDGYFAANFESDLKGLSNVSKGPLKDKTDKKGRGLTTFKLNEVYADEDGNAILVTEDYGYAENSKGRRKYYFGDNLFIKVGSKENDMTIATKRIGGNFCMAGSGGYCYYKGSVYVIYNDSRENLTKGENDKMDNGSCANDAIITLIKYNCKDNTVEKMELAAKNTKDHFTIDYPSVIQDKNNMYIHSYPSADIGASPGGLGKVTFK